MKGGYHSPPAKSKMSTRGLENSDLIFFRKAPKCVLLITQPPNIAQRSFVFKTNSIISLITSYKNH